jgi:hypothetical protein
MKDEFFIVGFVRKRMYQVSAYKDLQYWACVVGAHNEKEAEVLARMGMGIPVDVECHVRCLNE